MKKSASVKLTLVVAVATFAAACENEDARRCVDKGREIVVDDQFCQRDAGSAVGGWMPVYLWYYGGSGGTTWGGRYAGGSFTPVPHTTYVTPAAHAESSSSSSSSTIRGGFGSSAHSSFGG